MIFLTEEIKLLSYEHCNTRKRW